MEMKCQSFECMQYSFTGISLGSFVTTVTLYAMLMKHSSFGEKKIVTSSRYTNVHESHVSMGYKILKFVLKKILSIVGGLTYVVPFVIILRLRRCLPRPVNVQYVGSPS